MRRFWGILFALVLVFSLAAIGLPSPVLAQGSSSDVVYVDIDNVAGPWDGTSWVTAYQTIQEGLDDAYLIGKEVWVATGTYKPTPDIDRTVSFQLKSGVALYGGFDGTETMREQRNWATNVTILSGDIGTQGNNSDNSYHVVTGADGATIDGFTISGGNANGAGNDEYGGGMYNDYSSPMVTNCIFSNNSAHAGGGMNNSYSSPTVTNCTFSNNSATKYGGGGMNNSRLCSPTVTNCTFSNNRGPIGWSWGGGVANYRCSPTFSNCIFSNNFARWGGGIWIESSGDSGSPTITNCTFHSNRAQRIGGGMRIDACSPTVTNCTFSNNSCNYKGGGMANCNSSGTRVTNCTFSNNSATSYGGGIYNASSSPTVTNCILWDNGDEIYNEYSSTPVVSYSDIQGGYSGEGNIDADPMFVDPASDYHLQAGSPCIDKGTNVGAPTEDIEGNPRPIDGDGDSIAITDMGAFEYVPPVEPAVEATVDFDPDTLNLKSKGKVVTVYIELPEGYDVEETDISTVMLNGIVPALAHPTDVGDYDSDGVPDLMVKFDRSDVQDVLEPGNEIEVTVSGQLTDGTTFEGTDTIRVIEKEKK